MKYKKIVLLLLSTFLFANKEVTSISEIFSEATTTGNAKYYYIQTDKNPVLGQNTSANANSLGGQLQFNSASLYGLSATATFMTTNGFLLNSDVSKIDTSVLGKSNGAYYSNPNRAKDSFSILGQAYLSYKYNDLEIALGRKVIKTPLVHAKEVRMLPSAVEGSFVSYKFKKGFRVEAAYLDKFKQRTSDKFINILEHALGAKTKEITGLTSGSVALVGVNYIGDDFKLHSYNYYAADFLNSFYIDTSYMLKFSDIKVGFSGQYINQVSLGNTDRNLAKIGSETGGKSIRVNAFGLKSVLDIKKSKFTLSYSNILEDDKKHDSLVLPWDGTPLYTNMITSNDLFQSVYGNGLKADSDYIGGSQAVEIAYSQKYDGLGLDGFSTSLAYLNTSNSKFTKTQHDYNAVVKYKHNKQFTLAVIGIWVDNNTNASADGAISQLKRLTQYRVIANYKF